MKFRFALIAVAAFATSAHAAPVSFGPGDVVYKRELKEALPNAFGGHDIWGRKRTVGLIELRYVGARGSTATFIRRDTRILTNETTVNRGGAIIGSVGGHPVFLAGAGHAPTAQALMPDETAIEVDLTGDRSIVIDGHEVTIISATANKVVIDIPDPPSR